MLKEVLQRETEKAERDLQNKQQEKAAAEAAKLKVRQFFAVKPSARSNVSNDLQVKQAFLDDRKSALIRTQRERAQRIATTSLRQGPRSPTSSDAPSSPIRMPGPGATLSGSSSTSHDESPTYGDASDSD